MKKLKGVISVFALSLCLLSPAQAEEQRYQTDLPLSVFDPQYYHPLPVSVAGGKTS